jgi:positive regulator of sigma E activity
MKPSVTEIGYVLDIEGDAAIVRMGDAETCKGCGMAALGLCRPSGPGTVIRAENRAGAIPGDRVTLALDRPVKMRGYLFAYLIPVASLVAGAFAGSWVSIFEGMEVISALFLFVLSLPFCLVRIRRLERSGRMHISRIENRPSDYDPLEAGGEGLDYLRILGN